MNKLQRVQNCAARVVSNTRKYDHITPVLKELHRLKIEQWIIFKIALLVFKCLNNMAPPYLIELIQPRIASRQRLRLSYSENKLRGPKTTRKTFADRAFRWKQESNYMDRKPLGKHLLIKLSAGNKSITRSNNKFLWATTNIIVS